MHVTLELPDDVAQHANAAREIIEAFVIEGYRKGSLSSSEIRHLLGFETGYELDGFLKQHQVWEHAYSIEDLKADANVFERNA